MLIRLIYASTVREAMDLNAFNHLVKHAQHCNQLNDITGMLIFDGTYFLQGLEGEQALIDELYAKLLRDTQHHTIQLLSCNEERVRAWTNWTMGFVAPSPSNQALFLQYTKQVVFNPYNLSPETAETLLVQLSNNIHAVKKSDLSADTNYSKPESEKNKQEHGLLKRIKSFFNP
jgi:hypothetical protein